MRSGNFRFAMRPSRARVGLARAATVLGSKGIGVLAIGSIAIKRGKIGRLSIEELVGVGRLRVGELVVEERDVPARPTENYHNVLAV